MIEALISIVKNQNVVFMSDWLLISIIKKERLKWFCHMAHKDNATYVNHSYEEGFNNRRTRGWLPK